jgi:hypothetical protein
MVLAASTIRAIRAIDLARLQAHQLDLVSSLIEAEAVQNATIKRALQAKVNETLKGLGVQDVGGGKTAK